jgi:hypothetical protein
MSQKVNILMKYIELLSTLTTHNKYYTWYVNICQSAKQRNLQKGCGTYIEKHHIIPRSFGLGGEKDKSNLVYLTAKEHYIVHKLLTKMLLNADYTKKMRYALWYLTVRKIGYVPNSKSYAYIRAQVAEENKKRIDSSETRLKKARPGKLNGMWGKTHTQEVKDKLSATAIKNLTGKTYEQLYGKDRAEKLKQDRSTKLKNYIKQNPTVRRGKNNSNAKTYKFIDPLGNEHIVEGAFKLFCKKHKLEFSAVINCAKGRRESYKGWTIQYQS